MEWTLKEKMKFLDEARAVTEEHRDGRTIKFECPLCAGEAYAMRDGNSVVSSCSDCYITQNTKV